MKARTIRSQAWGPGTAVGASASGGSLRLLVLAAIGPLAAVVLLLVVSPAQANLGFVTQWGGKGSGDGQFGLWPYGVATDAIGNVYVADSGNHRIQKFTSNGAFITKWGSEGLAKGQFGSFPSLATDVIGNVYVADYNHRIQKFTSSGDFITKWGSLGSGDGQFRSPSGVATDTAGNVYVVESGSFYSSEHRIQKFTSSGDFITKWGTMSSGDGTVSYPSGVATDTANNVYLADGGNNGFNERIQKFTSNGAFLTRVDGSERPYATDQGGVATDAAGNVYVAVRSANSQIQKFAPLPPQSMATATPPQPAPAQQPRLARPKLEKGPSGKTRARQAVFILRSATPGARFQCRLTGQRVPKKQKRWRHCGSPKRYKGLRPGKKVFWVRAQMGGKSSKPVRRAWTVVTKREGPEPLSIPTTAGKAIFRAVCPPGKRCQAKVRIKAGKKTYARGGYSVPAGKSRKVRLNLTKTGRKKLSSSKRVSAKATITDTRTGKSKSFPVVLKGRARR